MSDNPRQKSAGQPPVSAHPAFRVIVAVWFAALLGIGSMVLPIELTERFAVASGLSDAFAAAQPPLGATARLIVALGAATIGALLGLVVARLVAANSARPARGSAAVAVAADSPAKRPLSAHEDLFEGGLDADGLEPAPEEVIDRDGTPGEFPDIAPLPGAYRDDEEHPLHLRAFDEDEAAPSPAFLHHGESEWDELGSDWEPAESASAMRETAESRDRAFASEPVAERAPVPPVCGRPLGELGIVELVERFAIALDRHRAAERPAPLAAPSMNEAEGQPAALDREDSASIIDDEFEEEVAADYPSLLAIKTSSGREPVRLELSDADAVDDPVLVFPAQTSRAAMTASADEPATGGSLDAALARAQAVAQAAAQAANRGGSGAPASPAGGTERALRDALEKLQRLSGAA